MAQIADMVRRLGAAGCSVEQIAAEVEAREQEAEEVLAKRREQNRKAQQNHRARKHDGKTRQHDRPPVSMTKERSPTPPKENTPSERSKDLSYGATFGGGIPDPVYEDAKAKLFRVGKDILMMFGIREEKTGALIGRWLKQQPDPAVLLNAIHFARDRNVAEPIAYISTLLSNGASNVRQFRGRAPGQSLADLGFQMAEEIREREREIAAAGTGQFGDRS